MPIKKVPVLHTPYLRSYRGSKFSKMAAELSNQHQKREYLGPQGSQKGGVLDAGVAPTQASVRGWFQPKIFLRPGIAENTVVCKAEFVVLCVPKTPTS